MSLIKKLRSLLNTPEPYEKKLYQILSTPTYEGKNYRRSKLGEDMEVIDSLFGQYWKPRFLLNHQSRTAYEFMDANARLLKVDDADIDWNSLKGVPEDYISRIRARSARYPSFIRRFEDGVAEVQWQINPEGRYWMDEDGYGMTDDVAFNLYGYIDRECNPVVPFKAIKNLDDLRKMRAIAKEIIARRQ